MEKEKTKMSEDEILERKIRRAEEKKQYLLHQKELGKEMRLVKYLGKKIIRDQLMPEVHEYSIKEEDAHREEAIMDVIKTLDSHIYASTSDYYKFPLISYLKTFRPPLEYTLLVHVVYETIKKYEESEEISTSTPGSLTMKKLTFLREYIF